MKGDAVSLIIERREECLAVMAERKMCDHDATEVMDWYVDDTDILLTFVRKLENELAFEHGEARRG